MADRLGEDEVRRALREDAASADVTTALFGPLAERPARGDFLAEGRFVVAGIPVVATVFAALDPSAQVDPCVPEGAAVAPGSRLASVRTTARAALAGERVALNFLQRLSGIATLTRQAVDAVRGTRARITHTRKTTPGLRALERYAVTVGGGVENRASLAAAVLWKDNHWALLGSAGASLRDLLRRAPHDVPVIIEAENDAQFEEALAAGVRHILADNQEPAQIASWVRRAGPDVIIQASGGITPATARPYAEAGATLISIGGLTHSAPAAPITFAIA